MGVMVAASSTLTTAEKMMSMSSLWLSAAPVGSLLSSAVLTSKGFSTSYLLLGRSQQFLSVKKLLVHTSLHIGQKGTVKPVLKWMNFCFTTLFLGVR